MTALESLLEQALQLPDAERGKLAMQLLRTLEPEDEDEVSKDEWEAAWSQEIDRRVREVDDGSVELLDGDEVLADARAWLDAQRRRSGTAFTARREPSTVPRWHGTPRAPWMRPMASPMRSPTASGESASCPRHGRCGRGGRTPACA